MERSSTGLEEETCNHKEHANAVNRHTSIKHLTAEMRRARSTVNQRNTVEEDGAENCTRDKVLEHAFVRVDILAADAHESVNREAREFHRDEQCDKVNRLRHEQGTACGKHHEAISFAALELFTTERPLEPGNAEETAQENRYAEHATHRVHSVKTQESFRLGVVQSHNAQSDKERRNPRKHLVLVFVTKERFGSKSHHAAQNDTDNRQEIDNVIHHRKPPSQYFH